MSSRRGIVLSWLALRRALSIASDSRRRTRWEPSARVVMTLAGRDFAPFLTRQIRCAPVPAAVRHRCMEKVGSTARRGACLSAGPFPCGLPPNPACPFRGTGLSSDPRRTPSTVSAFCISQTFLSLSVRSTGPLGPVDGFPVLPGEALLSRLLRGLRRHRTQRPLGDPTFVFIAVRTRDGITSVSYTHL